MIPGSANPLLLASAAATGGYSISRSLRFNSADSAYLSRTPASAGNRKTWTWAGWVKRVVIGQAYEYLMDAGVADNFGFTANSAFLYLGSVPLAFKQSTAVFRDTSAWMHYLINFDSTNATAEDRCQIWINGARLTSWSSNPTIPLNTQSLINSTSTHTMCHALGYSFMSAYLADLHFCDGTAYDASAFGEFDTNGIWQPKAFAGSYGTQGWHLDFADNSSNTATTLGKDTSPNGNDWTVNNISVLDGNGPYVSQSGITAPSGGSIVNMYDGTFSTNALYGATTVRIFAGPSVTASSSLEIAWSTGSSPSVSVNGGAGISTPNGGGVGAYYTVPGFTGTINTIDVTFGANANVFGIRVDGQILLDFSVGAGNDSLVDVPTTSGTDNGNGGEVRGNYCTWNPLDNGIAATLSNGNLTSSVPNTAGTLRSTIGVSSGKWYWEWTGTSGSSTGRSGIQLTSTANTVSVQTTGICLDHYDGSKVINGSSSSYGSAIANGDVVMYALDLDNGKFWVGKNGTWYNSGSPVSGTNALTTGLSGTYVYVQSGGGGGPQVGDVNMGARSFAYTAPSGFKALCTANLPAPVVTKPSDLFDVKLYTGNGSTQTISGLGFSPDLVWIKRRDGANDHMLQDQIRGATAWLSSNRTDAENTNTSSDWFRAFTSDGFTVAYQTTGGTPTNEWNLNNATYAAWTWDAGSSTVTNTQGSITSSVRANASAGFSIVTYTGTGANATVGHGLGVAPAMLIIKSRTTSDFWVVGHTSLGFTADNYLRLNATNAVASAGGVAWNSTAPTSTVVHIGSSSVLNGSGNNLVMYAFAPVAGYSAMGSYVGNGSSNGSFIYTGFRPRFILMKDTTVAHNWQIIDSARDSYNVASNRLFPSTSGAEAGSNVCFDLLSNGFKARDPFTTSESGSTYIYFAVAESPFAYARAR